MPTSTPRKSWAARSILSILAMMFLAAVKGHAMDSGPLEQVGLRTTLQSIIEYVDSHSYTASVSLEEHLVLAYRLAAKRDPNLLEFRVLRRLCETIGLKRSAILAIALRGPNVRTNWDQCREFVETVSLSDFVVGQAIRNKAGELVTEPDWKLYDFLQPETSNLQSQSLQAEPLRSDDNPPYLQYNIYFGYLHSHSELSDGEGSPAAAYAYARDQGGLDFFALSDHGEMLDLWPWEDEWDELVDAARNAYAPGGFATLWGFEWSSPIYGHVTVLNTASFTDSISEDSINDLYHWLIPQPEAFGHHNHPGDYDEFGEEFQHLKYFPEVVPQMVGMENFNGNNRFDKYYYRGSWSADVYSYWDVGNRKGWYLGSLGSQDNHDNDWGTMNSFRTAVLAESLTREDIIEAYRQRRFYATEDKDLFLDLRCEGYPMGSRLSGIKRIFEISAWDGSGDRFEQVRLYRNGDLIETRPVEGDTIRVDFNDRSFEGRPAYYYVIVRQTDDNDFNGRNDEAISSPMWFDDAISEPPFMPWVPLLLLDE